MIKKNQTWELVSHLVCASVIISIFSMSLSILNAYFIDLSETESEPKSELGHIKLITDSDKRYYAQKDDCINLERKECAQLNVKLYVGATNVRQ
jgi:hypothetical protein